MPRRLASAATASETSMLKPTIMPSLASARSRSLLVMSPEAACRKRSITLSWGSASSAPFTASSVPDASAFRMMLRRCRSSVSSPKSSMDASVESVTREPPPDCAARRVLRSSSEALDARARASDSLAATMNSSPAEGTMLSPITSTAVEGPASLRLAWMPSVIARILPKAAPATVESPTRSVPFCTSSVAMGPRLRSRCASMTVPAARRSGCAKMSVTSDTSEMVSSRSSMPAPVLALMGIIGTSPPHSSGMTPACEAISCFTRSTSAPTLSHLLMATTMGTPAALACATASRVCGRTPSSAATMMTAMSVTRAPRARIALKASWPGVSRKVILRSTPSSVTGTV
mmetsp:Transcript_29449/g.74033  ORF Transcript_29449/g.74033 Transcript_29449/m.74033 type:complete len:346 (-) Transcript_29449:524-1561(-)